MDEKYEYVIYSSMFVKEYSSLAYKIYSKLRFSSDKDYDDYINLINNYSIASLDEVPNYGGDLLLLSTCTDKVDRGRLVIIAIKK